MESVTSTPQPTLSRELRALINQRNILSANSKAKVLSALDKQIQENNTKLQFDLRNKVIDEILTSEVSYLHQLETIMKFFKEPLESSNLVTSITRRVLFGNIEVIYQVNGELVNELRLQGDNVGAAFVYLAPFFKNYSMYAYEYKNTLSLLQDLTKHSAKFSTWLKCQESRPEVGHKFSSLLIAPIQRLPRYRLLLRQLLSLTPFNHPHHSTLVDAVREVEKATAHINSLVFEQETHARLVILQNCLVNSKPAIVVPNKKLLKEGVLMKMSENGQKAQRRYFILLNDSIIYCKMLGKNHEKLPVEPGSLQCCCVLPITKCSVDSVLGQGVFNLTCRSETYILFSEHSYDALQWVTDIKNAITQYQENLKTLQKKSSSRNPLHFTKKRKCIEENIAKDDGRPSKKAKMDDLSLKQQSQRAGYVQSIKGLFRSFGESVRQYLYPGSASR